MRRFGLLFAAVATFVGCGPGDNELGGSISELFPLEVSRVDVLRNEHALQISYYRNHGAEVDLVLRLTVALQDLEVKPGAKLDLAGEYAPGHPRTTVVHIGSGEPTRHFPRVQHGDLTIDEGGNVGEPTRGDFSLSFEQSGEFGSGRTAFGGFNGTAQDAGFGDP